MLVSVVLGLLAMRRGGLSAGTLLDALSASDDVMGAMDHRGIVKQCTDAAAARRCPPLVFTRLRAALADFVIERAETGGATVLCYYHRQVRGLRGGGAARLPPPPPVGASLVGGNIRGGSATARWSRA